MTRIIKENISYSNYNPTMLVEPYSVQRVIEPTSLIVSDFFNIGDFSPLGFMVRLEYII
jgi:hypothetical protein